MTVPGLPGGRCAVVAARRPTETALACGSTPAVRRAAADDDTRFSRGRRTVLTILTVLTVLTVVAAGGSVSKGLSIDGDDVSVLDDHGMTADLESAVRALRDVHPRDVVIAIRIPAAY